MPAADRSGGLKDFRINHHNKMKATPKGGFFLAGIAINVLLSEKKFTYLWR